MTADAAIHVDQLVRRYGDFEAVRGVSFQVGEGELFGFLGPNGVGHDVIIISAISAVLVAASTLGFSRME